MSDIVIAAMIEGASNILMAVIPVLALLAGGRAYLKTQQLREQLRRSLKDIQFLLCVEQEHIRLHKEHGLPASKRLVRSIASTRFDWSGQYTSARIKRKLQSLDYQDRQSEPYTKRLQ